MSGDSPRYNYLYAHRRLSRLSAIADTERTIIIGDQPETLCAPAVPLPKVFLDLIVWRSRRYDKYNTPRKSDQELRWYHCCANRPNSGGQMARQRNHYTAEFKAKVA